MPFIFRVNSQIRRPDCAVCAGATRPRKGPVKDGGKTGYRKRQPNARIVAVPYREKLFMTPRWLAFWLSYSFCMAAAAFFFLLVTYSFWPALPIPIIWMVVAYQLIQRYLAWCRSRPLKPLAKREQWPAA